MENVRAVIKPVLTEKSLVDASHGDYTFVVSNNATKKDIELAIKDLFKVDVVSVKTRTIKGRSRRVFRKRTRTTLGPIKKATVKVGKEQKIDIFEAKG